MTTEAKPLTADEIADLKIFVQRSSHIWPKYLCRTMPSAIATIEQQAEQIEKLRGALRPLDAGTRIVSVDDKEPPTVHVELFQSELLAARLALASTEPVNDKR